MSKVSEQESQSATKFHLKNHSSCYYFEGTFGLVIPNKHYHHTMKLVRGDYWLNSAIVLSDICDLMSDLNTYR